MTEKEKWRELYQEGVEAIGNFEFERAQECLHAALRELHDSGHGWSEDTTRVMRDYAHALQFGDEHDASRRTFEELAALEETMYGCEDLRLAETTESWGQACLDAGDCTQAEELAAKAIGICLPHVKHALRTYGGALVTLAHSQLVQGKTAEATKSARAGFAMLEMADGPANAGLAGALGILSSALKALYDKDREEDEQEGR
ncbi:MAG: tetratricopeptide repeat protein [Armatimonadetes bacterium]|nr:tetratricopeptide repeat protein [Armatimonadota bacterium]